jgi:hypothetical protein
MITKGDEEDDGKEDEEEEAMGKEERTMTVEARANKNDTKWTTDLFHVGHEW